MTAARDDRLRALALHYIITVDRFNAAAAAAGGSNFLPADDADPLYLAQRALLALLPAVVAPPCAMHDWPRRLCIDCQELRRDAHHAAVRAALARLGLRDPWSTGGHQ